MNLEVITLKSKKIFPNFKNFPEFYLAGGTGLALQLGHRISVDFDFFQKQYISKTLLPKIKKIFKDSKIKIIVNHPEQLTLIIQGVNVSFIRYPFLVNLKFIDYHGIKILPVLEIAAMKAYAIGRRATLKDYVDLYFTIEQKTATLKEIIDLCKKKYQDNFDPRLFLEQLIYSKDIEEINIKFLKKKIRKQEIEKFFELEVQKIKF
ncbi:MAG: nucleotidyl transferase AbiEii/AbiGii toxin family protein [Candidatus Pacebacteria bacterium]|nr:nucleotidyl transferase AbiEii/AbiGii toxin family protein [Candidatus Paceibacterota bacterium]